MDSPCRKRPRSDLESKSEDEDRISSLPEDVIGRILSRLSSREAQATCLLSRRWRRLCTSQVTDLVFDWRDLLDEMKYNPELAEQKRVQYAEWVDNVVRPQSGGDHTLRRFALRFDLNNSSKSCIDQWIRFALAKQVKVLELDFQPACFKIRERPPPYVLGHAILRDADVSFSRRDLGSIPSSSWHVGCRYLEDLSLNGVSVEGEFIEQMLANCPFLERLALEDAPTLNRLRVSGQSLKLKYLHIGACRNLRRVEISKTNLVSFTCIGLDIQLCLDKVPPLSEVTVVGYVFERVDLTMSQLSSLSCLQILKLQFCEPLRETRRIRRLCKLTSVKRLELRVQGYKEASLLPLTFIIEACPCLRSLVIELTDPMNMLCRPRELERVVRRPHRYLKEVEFRNYYGRPCDLELVYYIIENAVALEKLVVNPCEEEDLPNGLEKVKEPRERALQQLKGKLPSKIDLVIN